MEKSKPEMYIKIKLKSLSLLNLLDVLSIFKNLAVGIITNVASIAWYSHVEEEADNIDW